MSELFFYFVYFLELIIALIAINYDIFFVMNRGTRKNSEMTYNYSVVGRHIACWAEWCDKFLDWIFELMLDQNFLPPSPLTFNLANSPPWWNLIKMAKKYASKIFSLSATVEGIHYFLFSSISKKRERLFFSVQYVFILHKICIVMANCEWHPEAPCFLPTERVLK